MIRLGGERACCHHWEVKMFTGPDRSGAFERRRPLKYFSTRSFSSVPRSRRRSREAMARPQQQGATHGCYTDYRSSDNVCIVKVLRWLEWWLSIQAPQPTRSVSRDLASCGEKAGWRVFDLDAAWWRHSNPSQCDGMETPARELLAYRHGNFQIGVKRRN